MSESTDPPPIDLQQLLLQSLASWSDAGVLQLPQKQAIDISLPTAPPPPMELPRVEAAISPPSPVVQPSQTPPSEIERVSMSRMHSPLPSRVSDPAAELHVLAQEVSGCVLCHELATTRKQTVFGVGNPQARLVFFGEAPGADEDARGEPFVGRAGQLLTKIIEACTLRREDVYILNTLKCRPPGNRNPSAEEATNCRPFFEKQLELIQPEYLCCLGSVAAQNLLETTETIGKLRGRFHEYRGIKVIATYHPAYLLRNPSAKRQVWDDMQMLMKDMGIELPRA